MKLKTFLKEIYIAALEQAGRAWWVKMKTEQPFCIYYFGPFISCLEAKKAQPDYLQDLEDEQAQGITWDIEQCKPLELTFGVDV
jgi:Domain of unknown function (DUF1816)